MWCEGGLWQQSYDCDAALECAKDRKEWRSLVDMSMIEFNSVIFAWPSIISTALLRSSGLSSGDGSRYIMRLG